MVISAASTSPRPAPAHASNHCAPRREGLLAGAHALGGRQHAAEQRTHLHTVQGLSGQEVKASASGRKPLHAHMQKAFAQACMRC